MPKVELRGLSWSEVISCEPKRNVADISRHGYLYLPNSVALPGNNIISGLMPYDSFQTSMR